ncbi:HIRAN domain-containing protein [Aminobacter sp. J44]|uniref:HIRAN domain-containing protein n=1 Tax=Aminobacter sp. J44 TaxID=935262 RepID=UPI00352D8032
MRAAGWRGPCSPLPAPVVSTYITGLARVAGNALPPAGTEVVLQRDLSDLYDPHALSVSTANGERLGRIPPIHSRMLEPFVAAGYSARGWIEQGKGGSQLRISVALTREAGDA